MIYNNNFSQIVKKKKSFQLKKFNWKKNYVQLSLVNSNIQAITKEFNFIFFKCNNNK